MNAYVNDFNTTVQTYYKELKNCKPISREREKELFKKIKQGNGELAKQELLKSNLKFVFNVASKYKGKGVSLDELISEGNMGLIKAIDKFDYTQNIKFISYAVWWIRQSIQMCVKKRKEITSIEVFENDLIGDNDFEENDITIINDVTSEYDDLMSDLNSSKKYFIENLLVKLPTRGKKIIQMYYGLNNEEEKTLDEIGEVVGLTKERVRQIKEQCLKILRSEALMVDNLDEILY